MLSTTTSVQEEAATMAAIGNRGRIRAMLVAAVAAALVAVVATASGAGFADPSAPAVAPNPAAPGQTVTVSGAGCLDQDLQNGSSPGGHVVVTVAFTSPIVVGVDAAADNGAWSTTFTVPLGTPDGAYAITATCEGVTANELGALQTVFFTYPATSVTVGTPRAVVVAPAFTG